MRIDGGARLGHDKLERVDAKRRIPSPRVDFRKDLFIVRIIVSHEVAILDSESVSPKGEMADSGFFCAIYAAVQTLL